MTPEERELLRRSIALSEENNDILRGIQRSMRLSRIMSLVYWLFIIGSAIGAYYLVQPYIEAVSGAYSGASNNIDSIIDNFKDLAN